MHHIVVKEQDVYLETDMFVMCVRSWNFVCGTPNVLTGFFRTNKLLFGEGLISTLGLRLPDAPAAAGAWGITSCTCKLSGWTCFEGGGRT